MPTSVPAANGPNSRRKSVIAFIGTQANTRGWPYLAAWAHRIAGVLLVLYAWTHIVTLSALNDPERFNAKMKIFGSGLFVFLEWLLALPLIYHALNGGRLILYEVFENRKDDLVLKWVIALTALYLLLLAFCMRMGNQTISAPLFWTYTTAAAGCTAYVTVTKIRASGASIFWKLQRISGAFLFVMAPAHMIFMHLNTAMGHDARVIIQRLDNIGIRLVDLALLSAVLYHGACGLYSIGRDYIPGSGAKACLVALVAGATLVFAWIGLKLIVLI